VTTQLGSNLALFDVFFLNASIGWVISHEGYLFKTTNGGLNWDTLSTGYSQTNNISFINENIGFISGTNKVLKTTDGGNTWSYKFLLNLGHFWNNGMFITNENSGFVIGESGVIYHTTNGGDIWLTQHLNEFNDLHCVEAINYNDAISVGKNGTILKTENNGRNWISLISPVYHNLNSVQLLPGLILYAVGDSGSVIRSYNAKDWTIIPTPTNKNLNDLFFFDIFRGIVIGNQGMILKTDNGGTSWQNISTGISGNFKKIDFLNDTVGFIVAGNATLLKTTDGGISWDSTNQINRDNLYDLQFVNSSFGFIGSNYGVVYKTANAGESWFPLHTHYSSENITTIHFVTQYFGWVATESKKIFRTSDGGNSWSSRLNVYNVINSIDFFSTHYGVAVGQNGTIMIGDGGPPIPVELISFFGYQESGKVYLNWQTATELNNLMFEIQRKVVGSEWLTIGYKPGAGNTYETQKYEFIDDCFDIKGGSTLSYRLKQVDFNGEFNFSDEISISNLALSDYELYQNYPNPFNPATIITYQIPERGFVTLKVYDVLGNEVATLVSEEKPAGRYQVDWNAIVLPSGIYFYQLKAREFIETKKMILLK